MDGIHSKKFYLSFFILPFLSKGHAIVYLYGVLTRCLQF